MVHGWLHGWLEQSSRARDPCRQLFSRNVAVFETIVHELGLIISGKSNRIGMYVHIEKR